ncbi:MAG: hypothetical protein Kow0090_07200 [Myxococcota bacterium]
MRGRKTINDKREMINVETNDYSPLQKNIPLAPFDIGVSNTPREKYTLLNPLLIEGTLGRDIPKHPPPTNKREDKGVSLQPKFPLSFRKRELGGEIEPTFPYIVANLKKIVMGKLRPYNQTSSLNPTHFSLTDD